MATDNEMTVVDNQTQDIDVQQQQEKNNSDTWRKVTIGGLTGILLGASGAAVANSLSNQQIENTSEEQNQQAESNEIDVATSVSDKMSFGDAFATARSEVGPGGVFHWRGNVYNTYYEKEWDEMSKDDRVAFAHRAAPEIAHNHSHHQQQHEDHGHVADAHAAEVEAAMASEDPDVRLIGVQDVTMEDGSVQTFGAATVNGYDVVLVDMDHNGVFDYAGVDVNNNGRIDPNERMDIANSHITVNSFSREAGNDLIIQRPAPAFEDTVSMETQQDTNENWANSDDLPDYTNDSDIIG